MTSFDSSRFLFLFDTFQTHSIVDGNVIRWSWDRFTKVGGRALQSCNPVRWSLPSSLASTLESLERHAAGSSTRAARPVRLRFADVDVVFPRLDVAVDALRDFSTEGAVSDIALDDHYCPRALRDVCTCAGSDVDVTALEAKADAPQTQSIVESMIAEVCQIAEPTSLVKPESRDKCLLPETQRPERQTAVCSICLEGLGTRARWELPCSHFFHACCMQRWLCSGSTCPLCRRTLAGKTIRHNHDAHR